MKRKNLDQEEYSYQHTKQRLLERYGMTISKVEYHKLCKKVRERKNIISIGTNQQKKGLQLVIDTLFKSKIITVVWENDRDCITTVLPMRL